MQEMVHDSNDIQLNRSLLEAVKDKANEYIAKYGVRPTFMEVCGSHTMALAKTGIKQSLLNEVNFISGPGCPVCVTDQQSIDAMIALSERDNLIICTFGDMMRVPGSKRSLMDAKVSGRDVRVLYSPIDAIKVAEENPEKEVVFLGIGFETTIPLLALLVDVASSKNLENFSIWMTTKLVEPILRFLLEANEVNIDGFLLPGHVSMVIGEEAYDYLVNEYKVPGVIAGFELTEVLGALHSVIESMLHDEVKIINSYPAVVTGKGNKTALDMMEKYFEPAAEAWRGIGVIPNSGLDFKEEYNRLNAKKRFEIEVDPPKKTKCRCGEIIRGVAGPEDCPLFAKACHPLNPIGPCMVSSEGSCSAQYEYMRGIDDE